MTTTPAEDFGAKINRMMRGGPRDLPPAEPAEPAEPTEDDAATTPTWEQRLWGRHVG